MHTSRLGLSFHSRHLGSSALGVTSCQYLKKRANFGEGVQNPHPRESISLPRTILTFDVLIEDSKEPYLES